jgi:hypothetical protein
VSLAPCAPLCVSRDPSWVPWVEARENGVIALVRIACSRGLCVIVAVSH